MTSRLLPIATFLALALPLPATFAQMDTPPPTGPSSIQPPKPPSVRQAPQPDDSGKRSRLTKPVQPGDPQLNIPLRQAKPLVQPDPVEQKAPRAAPATGVDDKAARCEAEDDPAARAACRTQAAKAAKPVKAP